MILMADNRRIRLKMITSLDLHISTGTEKLSFELFELSGRFLLDFPDGLSGPCQHIVNQSDPGPVSLGEMEASNATLSPPDTKESSESI